VTGVRSATAASLALLTCVSALAFARPEVLTRRDDVVERLHGVDVADPYRWLEDGEAPEVQRWTEAQNAVTRRRLDRLPGRAGLERRYGELYEIGALGLPASRKFRDGRRYFYTRRDGKQNQPVLYVRDGVDGADRALVDVNLERADGTRALDWWVASDDGTQVAYGVSDDGSEESTLRVRDVASGRDAPDAIPRTRHCSLVWTPDGRGFYYTRYPAAGEVPVAEMPYHRAVFHHKLGDDPARDRKLFGDGRDLKDWPNVDLSPAGRWLLVTVNQGWSKSEVFLIDTAAAKPAAIPVAVGEEAHHQVIDALDDRMFLLTTSGAPRGRIFVVDLAADPTRFARSKWREIVEQSDEIIDSVAYFEGGLAVATIADAAARLRVYDSDGRARGEIALPGLGTLTGLSSPRDARELFYGFASFFTPNAIHRIDGGVGSPKLWRRLQAPIDASKFEVERVLVTSRDGSKAPLFLAHLKGARRDGTRPAVLTGYGGFARGMLPGWTPAAIPFLERGGTYALAVLRGGNEYGEDWHRAGMLGNKQNVFDDFTAAAEWLIENKVTSAKRLGISGRSNGGLLVGAALTQRPELYRAVVCGVPLLDMVRYHRFRLAALWTPEYGSPDDPAAFRWLHAYSPYHRVRDRVRYPAVYFYTAAADTRVDAMHARKMAARLQAANAGPNRILLWLESRAGHGAGKPLAKIIAQATDEWAFMMSELGVAAKK
jgi:prolyl oligopeptidase